MISQQPRADGQAPVDGRGRGRPGPGAGDARRARGGAFVTAEIQRLVDEGVSRQRDRRLLPDQRAVAGARGHAGPRGDRLSGDRRHEVLRAGRDQGRRRLPDVPGEPAGRGVQRVANSPRAGRADVVSARAGLRRRRGDHALGGGASRCPASPRRPQVAQALHDDDGAPARARRGGRPGRRGARRGAERDRLPGGAAGRADDRGAGPAREPRGARGGGARVRRDAPEGRSGSSCSRSRCWPTRTRSATTRAW